MWDYNDGKSESNILQNQFTAYLLVAVSRSKKSICVSRRELISTNFPWR